MTRPIVAEKVEPPSPSKCLHDSTWKTDLERTFIQCPQCRTTWRPISGTEHKLPGDTVLYSTEESTSPRYVMSER